MFSNKNYFYLSGRNSIAITKKNDGTSRFMNPGTQKPKKKTKKDLYVFAEPILKRFGYIVLPIAYRCFYEITRAVTFTKVTSAHASPSLFLSTSDTLQKNNVINPSIYFYFSKKKK